MGKLIVDTLRSDSKAAPHIEDIRGKGLMIGIQLRKDCAELVSRGLEAGVLINVTAGNTIRLLPPLIINEHEALDLAGRIAGLIGDFT